MITPNYLEYRNPQISHLISTQCEISDNFCNLNTTTNSNVLQSETKNY